MKRSNYNIEIKLKEKLLLYNVLTRGFALLEEKEYIEFYKNEKLWEKDEKKLKEFMDNGFITKEDDKSNFLKNYENLSNADIKILSITFVPTQLCNFNCFYCFEREKIRRMDDNTFKNSILFTQKMIERKEVENVEVCFFGGEPLLEIERIIEYGKNIKNICEKRNIKFSSSIITNGYYLTSENAKILISECNLSFAQVTFDGDRTFHNKRRNNSYDIILENLESIFEKKLNLRISVRIQVDRENLSSLKNLLIDLKRFDIYENFNFYFSPIHGEFEENLESKKIYFQEKEFGKIYVNYILPLIFELKFKNFELYPRPHTGGCSVVKENSYIIDADGSLKECWELIGTEDSFGNIYMDEEKFSRKLNNISLDSTCKNCIYLPICNGGCPLRRYKGEIKCSFWRYFLKEYLKKIYFLKENEGI